MSLCFVACSFPDPSIGNDAGKDVGTTDSAVADSSDNDTGVVDTALDPEVFPDIGADADPCDMDGDKSKNSTCESNPALIDCNDHTPAAHPQTLTDWVHLPVGDPSFWSGLPGDWDCSGTVEKQFTVQESCAAGSTLDCKPSDGIDHDPNKTQCGTSINEVTCVPAGAGLLNCKPGTLTPATMGCK